MIRCGLHHSPTKRLGNQNDTDLVQHQSRTEIWRNKAEEALDRLTN